MYRKVTSAWKRNIDIILLDIITFSISYLIAYVIRHGNTFISANHIYKDVYIIMLLLLLLVGFFLETYNNTKNRGYYKEFVEMFKQSTLLLLLSTTVLFFLQLGDAYSRITMMLSNVIFGVMGYFARVVWKILVKKNSYFIKNAKILVVVTTSELVDDVLKSLREQLGIEYKISGIVLLDIDRVGEVVSNVPVIANKETMISYVCREWVDEIFIQVKRAEHDSNTLIEELVTMGMTIHLVLMSQETLVKKNQFVEKFGGFTVLTSSLATASFRTIMVKRIMDICGAVIGCFATCILMIIIGPIIYIQSPGPILFKQERVGRSGKKFYMYKFRSMYLDAEARKTELMSKNLLASDKMFKLEHDPRIIGSEKGDGKGIGHFIRKYSIDEMPQFFNVLAGDMSLVGTRPPTVDEWDTYELHHRVRLAAKPGLTGLWQVSGRSQITDFEEVVKLDAKYIAEWNLGLDIKILLKTILVVFTRKGAI